jgi:hypothetical protein
MSRSGAGDPRELNSQNELLKKPSGHPELSHERLAPSGSRAGPARSHSADLRDLDSQRTRFRERGRTYRLRTSEVEALSDIGRFRVIDVQELSTARYQDDELRMRRDLRNLAGQGLLETRISRLNEGDREMVTLTKRGEELLRATGAIRKDQKTYHGVGRPRDLDHDADLYRVYRRESAKIERDGGRPSRVVLDFELKRDIYRGLPTVAALPENERTREEIAQRHGLPVIDGHIMVPDLRIEYETRDGDQARVDLELVTSAYQTGHIAAKASAGFSIYARSQDEGRVRRALEDSRLIQEVFSI